MRVRLPGLLLLLIITNVTPAFSQEDDGEGILSPNGFIRYWTVSGGAVYQECFDQSISSMRYQGFGAAPTFGFIKRNENNYGELLLQPSYASLHRNADKTLAGSVTSYRAALDYKRLFRIKLRNERIHLLPGGLLSMNFNYKKAPYLASTGTVPEYAISLGVAARIAKEIELDNQRLAHLSWTVGIPLIAHYSRPTYLNRIEQLDPLNKPAGDFLANDKTSFVGGKYFRVNSRVVYDYALHNGNLLAIGYQWEYYRIKTINTEWFAEHTISLTLMFNY